jgi:hypothetical protein
LLKIIKISSIYKMFVPCLQYIRRGYQLTGKYWPFRSSHVIYVGVNVARSTFNCFDLLLNVYWFPPYNIHIDVLSVDMLLLTYWTTLFPKLCARVIFCKTNLLKKSVQFLQILRPILTSIYLTKVLAIHISY